jgi:hypothetical protein
MMFLICRMAINGRREDAARYVSTVRAVTAEA